MNWSWESNFQNYVTFLFLEFLPLKFGLVYTGIIYLNTDDRVYYVLTNTGDFVSLLIMTDEKHDDATKSDLFKDI